MGVKKPKKKKKIDKKNKESQIIKDWKENKVIVDFETEESFNKALDDHSLS